MLVMVFNDPGCSRHCRRRRHRRGAGPPPSSWRNRTKKPLPEPVQKSLPAADRVPAAIASSMHGTAAARSQRRVRRRISARLTTAAIALAATLSRRLGTSFPKSHATLFTVRMRGDYRNYSKRVVNLGRL